jgi:hypothetical protein
MSEVNYNECNGKKVWIGVYSESKNMYTIVSHAFILGRTENLNYYGQFISTLWYSERKNVRDILKYSIVVCPRNITPCKIENHLNKISTLCDNQFMRYDYTFDCMSQYNMQKNETARVECSVSSGGKNSAPYMSIHLRKVDDNEFYISLPYVEFTQNERTL